MQRLEVSGAVRPIYRSFGVKGLNQAPTKTLQVASPGRDLHVSCFCFDNIRLHFYVLLRGSPTHQI